MNNIEEYNYIPTRESWSSIIIKDDNPSNVLEMSKKYLNNDDYQWVLKDIENFRRDAWE